MPESTTNPFALHPRVIDALREHATENGCSVENVLHLAVGEYLARVGRPFRNISTGEREGDPRPTVERMPEGTKSLTLKLPLSEYRRLRRHALDGETHQNIIATALREYLDRLDASASEAA